MVTTLHLTRGLPASGKSTWARELLAAAEPGRVMRLGRDELRRTLFDLPPGPPVNAAEVRITVVQEAAARDALAHGVDVVVDDMNLRMRYARAWARVAAECRAELAVHDFPTPLQTCLARDHARPEAERVGEAVLRDLHARFVAPLDGGPFPPVTPWPHQHRPRG